jgi:hypothetical protein
MIEVAFSSTFKKLIKGNFKLESQFFGKTWNIYWKSLWYKTKDASAIW